MLSLLTVSILVLIPGQGTVPLGTELLLVGIALAVVSMRLQGRTIRLFGSEGAWRWVWRLMPLNVATLAVLLAGLTLVVGEFGGLYWLALTVVVYFLWAALNAWWLMVEAASGTS